MIYYYDDKNILVIINKHIVLHKLMFFMLKHVTGMIPRLSGNYNYNVIWALSFTAVCSLMGMGKQTRREAVQTIYDRSWAWGP